MANDQGYVTSVAFSPMLGHWIGLGLLRAAGRRASASACAPTIRCAGGDMEVEVVSPVFFDPEGARLHG